LREILRKLSLFAIILAASIVVLLVLAKTVEKNGEGSSLANSSDTAVNKFSISASPASVAAGSEVSIFVVGVFSCEGELSISLDGRPVPYDAAGDEARAKIRPDFGESRVVAKKGACSDYAKVDAFLPDCGEGQQKACVAADGCDGAQKCRNGKWAACYKNPRVCVPDSTVACSLNSCSFGARRCNACGTGYGSCINQY